MAESDFPQPDHTGLGLIPPADPIIEPEAAAANPLHDVLAALEHLAGGFLHLAQIIPAAQPLTRMGNEVRLLIKKVREAI